MKKNITVILLFIVLATATHLVQRQIRGKLGESLPINILYLPKGEYVKVIALGFDNFMGDMLWLRTLQYFGGHFMYDRQYPIIDRLLEVITTLEPNFTDVYSFGAMVLHEEAHQRDKAVALLDKGIQNNPNNWNIPYQLGFLWLEEMQGANDSTYRKFAAEKAKEAYAIATTKPNCEEFVSRMVTQMNYDAGYQQVAIESWQRTYDEAEKKGDKLVMQIAQDKLLLYKFHEVVDPVRNAVRDYYKKFNKVPEKLSDVVKEGFIKSIPKDPLTGEDLEYNPKSGWVSSPVKPQF